MVPAAVVDVTLQELAGKLDAGDIVSMAETRITSMTFAARWNLPPRVCITSM